MLRSTSTLEPMAATSALKPSFACRLFRSLLAPAGRQLWQQVAFTWQATFPVFATEAATTTSTAHPRFVCFLWMFPLRSKSGGKCPSVGASASAGACSLAQEGKRLSVHVLPCAQFCAQEKMKRIEWQLKQSAAQSQVRLDHTLGTAAKRPSGAGKSPPQLPHNAQNPNVAMAITDGES